MKKPTEPAHVEPLRTSKKTTPTSPVLSGAAAVSSPVLLRSGGAIALKELSAHLGVSQSTISRIVNGGATAHRISKATQKRVLEAAATLGYEASIIARSLRHKRTFTVGVLVPEISEGYSTAVLGGIEDELLKEGLFYFVASHRHHNQLLQAYPRLMISRAVDGIIAVDTNVSENLPVPVVAVSGHWHNPHGISVEIDHKLAAHLALEHLYRLGHRKIAFIKGQAFSSDTNRRWKAIREVAGKLGIAIEPGLVTQLKSPDPGPEPGHAATQQLLRRGHRFTAIFSFNDVSAVGAMAALREAGLQIPRDVSVIGFDDVIFAASSHPALTTVRQPLREMGRTAACALLGMIEGRNEFPAGKVVIVTPELVIRKSTARVPSGGGLQAG